MEGWGKKWSRNPLLSQMVEKYEGEYKDGERNGQGTYTWNDGRKVCWGIQGWSKEMVKEHTLGMMVGKYVGEFKEGLKNMVKEHTLHLMEKSI